MVRLDRQNEQCRTYKAHVKKIVPRIILHVKEYLEEYKMRCFTTLIGQA